VFSDQQLKQQWGFRGEREEREEGKQKEKNIKTWEQTLERRKIQKTYHIIIIKKKTIQSKNDIEKEKEKIVQKNTENY